MTERQWTTRRAREIRLDQWSLLAKAFYLLLIARLALRLLPIGRILAWQRRQGAPSRSSALSAEQCRLVRWAILVVTRHSPVHFVCFPQCLAASALLRQRGIECRLHYGVTRKGEKLETHTWLEACGEIVIGGEVAQEFSTLAVY